jgi:predicted alpha/beta hydrolase family esterase
MSNDVFVFHGAGEPRLRDGRVYWEPMLEGDLGAGFRIRAPRMPEPDDPRYEPWANRIAELVATTDRPLLVGHSFGASTLLKFLARATPRPAVRGVFLVATPFWGDDFADFALEPADFDRLQDLSPLFLYRSRDDDVVGEDQLTKYTRALPHANIRVLDGRGHEFDQPSFPELATDIRRCGNYSNQRHST